MLFGECHEAIITYLRQRIYNGELTERGLAKLVGVSQPHINAAIQGKKALSKEVCDRILICLHISLLDLIGRDRMVQHLRGQIKPDCGTSWFRTLEGKIGPGQPWPSVTSGFSRFVFPEQQAREMHHPVAAQISYDSEMKNLLAPNSWVLLDQTLRSRSHTSPDSLYLIQLNQVPLLRHVRVLADKAFIISHKYVNIPAGWTQIPLPTCGLPALIRAQAHPLTPAVEWRSCMPAYSRLKGEVNCYRQLRPAS